MKKGGYAVIAILCVAAVIFGICFFRAKGDITSLNGEIAKLHNNVSENEQTINTLTKQGEEKDNEIGALTADVADRDARIEGLSADVADRDKQIEGLSADVAGRDAQIEALSAQVKSLAEDVADRDSQIEGYIAQGDLGETLASRDEQIEGLNADIADRDKQIEGLSADVADRDAQIEGLTADIADRDAQIKDLSADIAAMDTKLEDLTADIAAKDSQIDSLIAQIVALTLQPTPAPTPDPTPVPTPTPLPVEGRSTAGTQLMNIRYDGQGRILSLTERDGSNWTDWTYIYSSQGSFLYRIKNIGGVEATGGDKIPGTSVQGAKLSSTVQNCVGFTLQYSIYAVSGGDGLGTRDLYIHSLENGWQKVGQFEYPAQNYVTASFALEKPMTIDSFGTLRQHPDGTTRFSINQQFIEIWVADYTYVQPAG